MKRIIYILIFGFILSSCDDFLTEEPVHKQTLENAVVDYDGAQNIINGMYASLTLGSGTSGSDFFGGSLACALSSQAGVSRAGGTTFYSMSYTSTTNGYLLATMVCLRERRKRRYHFYLGISR